MMKAERDERSKAVLNRDMAALAARRKQKREDHEKKALEERVSMLEMKIAKLERILQENTVGKTII